MLSFSSCRHPNTVDKYNEDGLIFCKCSTSNKCTYVYVCVQDSAHVMVGVISEYVIKGT